MPRPRIEFVQSQFLPWQTAPVAAARPGAEARVLSRDPDTGALSLLVRYPAGWAREGEEWLPADEEFLVLQGALEIDGRRYGLRHYAHLPERLPRRRMAAPDGALVLTFFSAAPVPRAGPPPAPPDPARTLLQLDGFAVPYTGRFHPEFPPGAGRKVLYDDPVTGDQSWMLGTLPMRWAERAERHPVVEEMFLIHGEVHGNLGVMRPGAYFWRPPGIPHGPYGTLTGNLYFFRTKGGPLSTEYEDPAEPFRWDPPHAPILPEEIAPFAAAAPSAADGW